MRTSRTRYGRTTSLEIKGLVSDFLRNWQNLLRTFRTIYLYIVYAVRNEHLDAPQKGSQIVIVISKLYNNTLTRLCNTSNRILEATEKVSLKLLLAFSIYEDEFLTRFQQKFSVDRHSDFTSFLLSRASNADYVL